MQKIKSKPILVANWKMNGDLQSISRLVKDLKADLSNNDPGSGQIIIFPPHVYLQMVAKDIRGTRIFLGGQDADEREIGSVTGGVSAKMLYDVGCKYVLLGHSERRILFNERNSSIFRKLKQALKVGLKAIVCIGENSEQRNSGRVFDVISGQLKSVINKKILAQSKELLIAYEPVWAIGASKSANIDQIENALLKIREILGDLDSELPRSAKILYGGSVTEKNIAEILAIDEVDGALIGGASLDSRSFNEICRIAQTI